MGGRLERVGLGLLSIVAALALYAGLAAMVARPDRLPTLPTVLATLSTLVAGPGSAADHAHGHGHGADHVGEVLKTGLTLPGALLVSTLRVLVGVGVGGTLGVVAGLAMGWSRAVDGYLHPLYVLLRSVPPLALITYVMLWFGHGEAHRLIPIVYAVAATLVIPTYHGIREVGALHVQAARGLGASGSLLLRQVVVPAAAPFVLSGLRYALIVAWMTTVGVEMLMADDGLGQLVVGGGLWASRHEIRADPAVVMVAILAMASAGWAMDAVTRLVAARLTAWRREPARW